MSDRRSTGKRLRFEILKRDGFACRYCGADATMGVLHVDHVIPVVDGGTDDPANLVTACASCNLGKSDVSISESRLARRAGADELLEQAEQIRAYLEAVKNLEDARNDVCLFLYRAWEDRTGSKTYDSAAFAIDKALSTIGLARTLEAINAVAERSPSRFEDKVKYFYGVVRRMRDRSEQESGS